MCAPTEIIILFFIVSFLVYTMPMVLVKFSKSLKGKFLLLLLTIVITLYNRTGGIVMAMLLIFLSEFNYEVNNGIIYEGFELNADPNAEPNAEPNASKEKKAVTDQLSVESQLTPVNTSTIPVSQTE
jgi:hypothetical protein